MDALTQFVSEMWTLFGVAAAFTFLRVYARIRAVGLKGLQADDYLAFAAIFSFAGEVVIAFMGGSLYYSEAAAGNLPQQMKNKPEPGSPVFELRAKGAKYHFASWPLYTSTLWLLKASLLILYLRLTSGLSGRFRCRIKFGFILLAVSWVVIILTTFLACRPFQDYFSLDPIVPNECVPAVSKPIVWTCYAFNAATDMYLISVPLPMLWKVSMMTWKKVGLGILFSAGVLIIVFATIRCVLLTIDPINGSPVSGTWAVRETFVAIITTNFPMVFTLIKGFLGPAFRSYRTSDRSQQRQQYRSSEMKTFGSSSGQSKKPRGVGNPTATNMLFSASEERMVNGDPTPGTEEESMRWSGPTLHTDPGSRKSDVEKQPVDTVGIAR